MTRLSAQERARAMGAVVCGCGDAACPRIALVAAAIEAAEVEALDRAARLMDADAKEADGRIAVLDPDFDAEEIAYLRRIKALAKRDAERIRALRAAPTPPRAGQGQGAGTMTCEICGRPLDSTPGNMADAVCWREVLPPKDGDHWNERDARECYALGYARLRLALAAQTERAEELSTALEASKDAHFAAQLQHEERAVALAAAEGREKAMRSELYEAALQRDAGAGYVKAMLLSADGGCDVNATMRTLRDARDWSEEEERAAAKRRAVLSPTPAIRHPPRHPESDNDR